MKISKKSWHYRLASFFSPNMPSYVVGYYISVALSIAFVIGLVISLPLWLPLIGVMFLIFHIDAKVNKQVDYTDDD